MKKLLVLFLLFPILIWAQDDQTRLNLPKVSNEEKVSELPGALPVTKLTLPEVVKRADTLTNFFANFPIIPLSLPRVVKRTGALPGFQMPVGLSLTSIPSRDLTVDINSFEGGLNYFFPEDKLSTKQFLMSRNLVSEGAFWLKIRSGTQKIYFTSQGAIYGMAFADSGSSKSHLVVIADNDIYWADSSSDWELIDVGNTTAEPTYFASTPFGLVILNDGTDSARIWDGIDVEALGVCDTGTVDADSTYTNGDTAWIADSSACWAMDYWIGYWVQCGTLSTSLFKIIDSGVNWLDVVDCGDTCDDSTFVIIARPDSVSGGLIYPKGKAGAYYQDRFFMASAYYPYRIYYSEIRLPNDIPPDHIIDLDMDKHDEIQRMWIFNNYLFVGGKHSIYGIDADLKVYPNKSMGIIAPKTLAIGDDYCYFLSDRGAIYRFKGNLYGSFSYSFENISDQISKTIAGINAEDLDNCGGIYLNRQYWFSYHPDSCMVFDERTTQWLGPQTFGFSDALSFSSVFNKTWDEMIVPDADGDTTDWSCASEDEYTAVDNYNDVSDSIWVENNGKLQQYDFSDPNYFYEGSNVAQMRISILGRRTYNFCSPSIDLYVSANGQRYLIGRLEDFAKGSYTIRNIGCATNPVTDLPWTKGDLDSLTLTLKYNHPCANRLAVAHVIIFIEYAGDFPSGNFIFGSPSKSFVYKYGGTFDDDTSSVANAVYGEPVISSYQSGWFDAGLPNNQKIIREFFTEVEKDTGQVNIYLYKDFETTAIDTQHIYKHGKRSDWFLLPDDVAGKKFSIKIETTSEIDSLTLKRVQVLIRDLGKR